MMTTVRAVPILTRLLLALAAGLVLGGCALEAEGPGDPEPGEVSEPLEEEELLDAEGAPEPGSPEAAEGPEGEPDPYPWRITAHPEPDDGPCPWTKQAPGSRP